MDHPYSTIDTPIPDSHARAERISPSDPPALTDHDSVTLIPRATGDAILTAAGISHRLTTIGVSTEITPAKTYEDAVVTATKTDPDTAVVGIGVELPDQGDEDAVVDEATEPDAQPTEAESEEPETEQETGEETEDDSSSPADSPVESSDSGEGRIQADEHEGELSHITSLPSETLVVADDVDLSSFPRLDTDGLKSETVGRLLGRGIKKSRAKQAVQNDLVDNNDVWKKPDNPERKTITAEQSSENATQSEEKQSGDSDTDTEPSTSPSDDEGETDEVEGDTAEPDAETATKSQEEVPDDSTSSDPTADEEDTESDDAESENEEESQDGDEDEEPDYGPLPNKDEYAPVPEAPVPPHEVAPPDPDQVNDDYQHRTLFTEAYNESLAETQPHDVYPDPPEGFPFDTEPDIERLDEDESDSPHPAGAASIAEPDSPDEQDESGTNAEPERREEPESVEAKTTSNDDNDSSDSPSRMKGPARPARATPSKNGGGGSPTGTSLSTSRKRKRPKDTYGQGVTNVGPTLGNRDTRNDTDEESSEEVDDDDTENIDEEDRDWTTVSPSDSADGEGGSDDVEDSDTDDESVSDDADGEDDDDSDASVFMDGGEVLSGVPAEMGDTYSLTGYDGALPDAASEMLAGLSAPNLSPRHQFTALLASRDANVYDVGRASSYPNTLEDNVSRIHGFGTVHESVPTALTTTSFIHAGFSGGPRYLGQFAGATDMPQSVDSEECENVAEIGGQLLGGTERQFDHEINGISDLPPLFQRFLQRHMFIGEDMAFVGECAEGLADVVDTLARCGESEMAVDVATESVSPTDDEVLDVAQETAHNVHTELHESTVVWGDDRDVVALRVDDDDVVSLAVILADEYKVDADTVLVAGEHAVAVTSESQPPGEVLTDIIPDACTGSCMRTVWGYVTDSTDVGAAVEQYVESR